ncbi:GNAT family N-acetyltransferase [Thalassomonas viridans]|uniref:GNAT family N-acetyltransferase n=1 Tax=Thalassomonas viridans TaxID=137584 RepID=A0AAF0C9T0_9GAMM|nr:GNAT family N-acetyltransferase [Thalassomonas viridans]WDE05159.1 GNAT family N-acetyltransferase [Thalassomonas viridans]
MKHYPLKNAGPEIVARIARGILNTYDLSGLPCIDRDKALANEIKDLLVLNEDIDPESLNKVRQRRRLDDTIADEALMPQIFERDNGQVLLAHVCRNEADETMIEIFSEEALDLAELRKVTPAICRTFSWCRPKYINVWTRPYSAIEKQLLALPGSLACEGAVAAKKEQLLLETDSPLQLRPFNLGQDWPWYQQEYNNFLAENPKMKTIVPITDKEDIEQAIADKLCVCAVLGDEPIGMIMGESSQELGYNGLLITDIFIAGQYRGSGYAAPMQRLFIKENYREFDFFLGFIDRNNLPSLKNAFKQGRKVLRQEIYIPTAHLI